MRATARTGAFSRAAAYPFRQCDVDGVMYPRIHCVVYVGRSHIRNWPSPQKRQDVIYPPTSVWGTVRGTEAWRRGGMVHCNNGAMQQSIVMQCNMMRGWRCVCATVDSYILLQLQREQTRGTGCQTSMTTTNHTRYAVTICYICSGNHSSSHTVQTVSATNRRGGSRETAGKPIPS